MEEDKDFLAGEAPDEAKEKGSDQSQVVEKVFCVKCGAEVAPGNAFCPKCGHKVGEKLVTDSAQEQTSTTAQKKQPNKKTLRIIAGAIVAIVAVIAVILFVRGVQAKDVTLNKKAATVKVGETVTLSYTINPSDTKDKTVTWASSNESIAQVNGGTITGVNEGDCTITVSTKNGKTDICSITVTPAGPDLEALYNEYCTSSFATIASDGSYLSIDTNPNDKEDYFDMDAYEAIVAVNEALGLPESVINRMNQTRSIDGVQSYSTDELEISWTYHPDNGMQVNYSLK